MLSSITTGGKPRMSRVEARDAGISPHLRDWCAHLIPKLQKCRQANNWLAWKCEPEKLRYERCAHQLHSDREYALEQLRKVKTPVGQLAADGAPFPDY
jgi:NADH dehydrogenase (ubiquinone) 1 beta subcomplex subunit 7